MEKINIVLVDDHKIIMEGISALLNDEEGIEVVGQAMNSVELFMLLENHVVHVVLLDIFLPKPVGIEILKSVLKQYPDIRVILLTGNDEEVLISNAFQAGGAGYLTKGVEKAELIEAIYSVNTGGQYVSRSLEKSLTWNFIKNAREGDKFALYKQSGLTARENEIIRYLSDGLSYKEVAGQLDISTRTVEAHKNNILEKLELKNTIELVKYAIKNKLVEL
jgi:DNA-binding NarL/FixJ family response regulator